MANALRLKAVLALIEKDPKHWDQEQFTSYCGTKHCFGGWAHALFSPNTLGTESSGYAAQRELNLTDTQADKLFYDCCSVTKLPTLRKVVKQIIAGEQFDE